MLVGVPAIAQSRSFTQDLDPALSDFVLDFLVANYELPDPRRVR
jgi:hypothetical protein